MNPSGFLSRHSLVAGILLMFVLTWPLDLGLAAESRGWLPFHIPEPIGLLVGYGFVAASLIMTGLTQGWQGIRDLLRRFLIWKVGFQWYLVALFGLAVASLAAVSLTALFRGAPPDFSLVYARRIFGDVPNLWVFILPFFLVDLLTNGEEIGWRGYALPRLQARYSALVASLVLGVIWGLWHIPKFLMEGNANPFGWFLLDTLAKAILFTWMFNNTRGSLLLVSLFHAGINTAGVFFPVSPTVTGDNLPYILVVLIEWLAALGVILSMGPAHLTRRLPVPSSTLVSGK